MPSEGGVLAFYPGEIGWISVEWVAALKSNNSNLPLLLLSNLGPQPKGRAHLRARCQRDVLFGNQLFRRIIKKWDASRIDLSFELNGTMCVFPPGNNRCLIDVCLEKNGCLLGG
jgi:hypothetical protein